MWYDDFDSWEHGLDDKKEPSDPSVRHALGEMLAKVQANCEEGETRRLAAESARRNEPAARTLDYTHEWRHGEDGNGGHG
jgi:hypothetical protein